ncbi:hypothetical protein GQ457_01G051300 [Hibiscus cannabinus]
MAEPSIQENGEVTVKIGNNSGHTISLVSIMVWEGNNHAEPFLTIKNGDVGEITIDASQSALVFNIEHVDGISWVLVWNTPIGPTGKVFTDIVKQPINWDHIRSKNDVLGRSDSEVVNFAMAEPSVQKLDVTVKIRNDSGHTISLVSIKVWKGHKSVEPLLTIKNGDAGEITIDASQAALVFNIEHDDGKNWILAWTTPVGPIGKVFTDIVKQPIDWDYIRNENDMSGKSDYEIVKFGYKAGIKFHGIPNDTSSSVIYIAYMEKIILAN